MGCDGAYNIYVYLCVWVCLRVSPFSLYFVLFCFSAIGLSDARFMLNTLLTICNIPIKALTRSSTLVMLVDPVWWVVVDSVLALAR